jgi:hypothetical protein
MVIGPFSKIVDLMEHLQVTMKTCKMVVKPIHFRKCITCDSFIVHTHQTWLYIGWFWSVFTLFSKCVHMLYNEDWWGKWQWKSSLWITLPALLWFGLYKPTQTLEHILTSCHNILLFVHSIMHNDIITLIDIGFQCSFYWT